MLNVSFYLDNFAHIGMWHLMCFLKVHIKCPIEYVYICYNLCLILDYIYTTLHTWVCDTWYASSSCIPGVLLNICTPGITYVEF